MNITIKNSNFRKVIREYFSPTVTQRLGGYYKGTDTTWVEDNTFTSNSFAVQKGDVIKVSGRKISGNKTSNIRIFDAEGNEITIERGGSSPNAYFIKVTNGLYYVNVDAIKACLFTYTVNDTNPNFTIEVSHRPQ